MLRSAKDVSEVLQNLKQSRVDEAKKLAKLQEVVEVILNNSPAMRELRRGMGKVVSYVDNQSERDKRAQFEQFLQSLSPLSFLEKHKSVCATYQPGTRTELIEQILSKLNDDTDQVIWCASGPGSGKTLLTAAVVERLKQSTLDKPFEKKAEVAFLYCDYNDQTRQTTLALVGCLVCQFAAYSNSAYKIVKGSADMTVKGSADASGQAHVLQEIARKCPRKRIILVDALDECSSQDT